MYLREIADIQPGLPFRSRIESEMGAEFIVVRPRDLGDDGRVSLQGAARVASLPVPALWSAFLEPGDVLLHPRGPCFPAAWFDAAELPAVAAAPLYRLRPDSAHVVPEFLVALLMSRATQAKLRQSAVGTRVPQVPRQAIETLRVELPDLSSQIRLVEERRGREQLARMWSSGIG
jgi:hypothetical protein